jgi:Arc/MetJ family transcription regulator
MHMGDARRTTINIDPELLERARRLSGIKRKTDLVRAGLEALIQREAVRRLADMSGSIPGAKAPPRRRWRKSA